MEVSREMEKSSSRENLREEIVKDVFISYNNRDQEKVDRIVAEPEDANINCWIAPRDIEIGSFYTSGITTAIESCKIFLLIMSNNAQSSKYVIRELDQAFEKERIIIPFMLENCTLTSAFSLLIKGTQQILAYENFDKAIKKLMIRIRDEIEKVRLPGYKKGKYIECPKCGCRTLIEHKTFLEKIRHMFTEDIKDTASFFWTSGLGFFLCTIGATILTIILICIVHVEIWYKLMLIVLLAVLIAGITCLVNGHEWLRRYQVRRHIQIWHFRCSKCEARFKRVVKEGQKKEKRVECLIR